MGFFSKKPETEAEKQPPRNPNNTIAFRLLAVGYIAYLCMNIVKLYMEGGPDAPSVTALVLGIVFLGGGAVFLGVMAYREWKTGKAAYDQYMAELRVEAEAKRAAEEAQALADAEEDAYYDALEAAEEENQEDTTEE